MISHKHHTVYIHIPKVAGQSIETLFLNDLGLNWETRGELLLRKKKSSEKGPSRLAHLTAEQYVDLGYIDKKTYQEYFTFSFVRNPYARAISLYNYLGYSSVIPFTIFIEKIVSKKIEANDFFFLPQHDYLYSKEGELLVDFIGRLETIDTDILSVIKESGIKKTELPYVNKSRKGYKRGFSKLVKSPSFIKHAIKKKDRLIKNQKDLTPFEKNSIYNLYKRDFQSFNYDK
jgi:hypothetical protein